MENFLDILKDSFKITGFIIGLFFLSIFAFATFLLLTSVYILEAGIVIGVIFSPGIITEILVRNGLSSYYYFLYFGLFLSVPLGITTGRLLHLLNENINLVGGYEWLADLTYFD